MKTIHLSLLGLLVSTSAATAGTTSFYGGLAVGWDHLSGHRSESLVDYGGEVRIFSNKASLSDNKMNGYGFLGIDFNFKNTPIFLGPEIQIGQGNVGDRLNVIIYQPAGNPLAPIPRHPSPEISRKFTSNFALRIGGNLNECSQLYALGGIDLARLRYKYTWETIDLGNELVSGYQTKEYNKWKIAPLFGIGFERKFNQHFKIGAEWRMSIYRTIKVQQTFDQTGITESSSGSIKPKVSSVLLRFSYVL